MTAAASNDAPACPAGKRRIQCKACPWRKDVVPERDIPGGYSRKKHEALRGTIAMPGRMEFGPIRKMACHESESGAEVVCVGWLANQLGPGNNIALRLQAAMGHLPMFELVGEQHERFEDTLPKGRHRSVPSLTHEQLKLVRMRAWAAGADPDEAERRALEPQEHQR